MYQRCKCDKGNQPQINADGELIKNEISLHPRLSVAGFLRPVLHTWLGVFL
jgi:hypothetical protein